MTDYKSLKLIASSSPHIRSNEDTRSIMLGNLPFIGVVHLDDEN